MNNATQQILLSIVQTWVISGTPTSRGFRCGLCQRYINEAWHHLLTIGGYKTPVHLCETCEVAIQKSDFKVEKPFVDSTAVSSVYSEEAVTRFKHIIETWQADADPVFKAFTCDNCENELEIDTRDGMRKGWHVWWRMDDARLAELHFHESCGTKMRLLRSSQ